MPTDLQISNINSYKEEIKELFKAAISVDCVIFGYDNQALKILTIHSELEAYKGLYSLVGDLVHPDETLENAAERILEYRTGLRNVHLEQIKSFGNPNRHPVGRVITTAFFSLINIDEYNIDIHKGLHPEWIDIKSIDKMAFDHKEILSESLKNVRRHFFSDALYANLLREKFTLSELQELSEAVLDKKFDKRNFRKKMLNSNYLIETDERQLNVNHRPARLYMVNQKKNIDSKTKH